MLFLYLIITVADDSTVGVAKVYLFIYKKKELLNFFNTVDSLAATLLHFK